MNLATVGTRYGWSQYRYPLSFQLRNTSHTLFEADSTTHRLEFLDERKATITFADSAPAISFYQCLPVAEDIYLVSFEIANIFAVIDLGRNQVVLIDLSADVDSYRFCSLNSSGTDAVSATFTDQMTDTAVRWIVGDNCFFTQRYVSREVNRIGWSPRSERERDSPAQHIRLTDDVFIVVVKGSAPPGVHIPQALGTLVLVQDFHRMTLCGVALSTVFNERVLFSGYGQFADQCAV